MTASDVASWLHGHFTDSWLIAAGLSTTSAGDSLPSEPGRSTTSGATAPSPASQEDTALTDVGDVQQGLKKLSLQPSDAQESLTGVQASAEEEDDQDWGTFVG